MKIVKFSKHKNGFYLLTLNTDECLKIHEDLILKYKLLVKKEIFASEYEGLMKENEIYEIYAVALKYIKVRLRSKKKLRIYLKKKQYSDEVISDVISLLVKQGYINDLVYATSFVNDRIKLSSYGPDKIRKELLDLDISNSIIDNELKIFTEDMQKDKINKLIQKKVKTNRNKGIQLLKRKIQNDLILLGYRKDLITSCLSSIDIDDSEVYKKEYNKIYTKLSKKYSGFELDCKLKQALYQKGFTYRNID